MQPGASRPYEPDPARFSRRLEELRRAIRAMSPETLAANTGASLQQADRQEALFQLDLWYRPVLIRFPELVAREAGSGKELSDMNQALLMYYFSTADGTPLRQEWISFAELPDGRFYTRAFQSYTGMELGRYFASSQERFRSAALRLGGSPASLGTISFVFQALPRVPILTVFWEGDEDFPPSYQLLFDASASHYLPTDAYAILGSTLVHRMIAASDR